MSNPLPEQPSQDYPNPFVQDQDVEQDSSYTKGLPGNIQLIADPLPPLIPSLPNESHRSLTLDEPILSTILRDLQAIWYKLKYVLRPKFSEGADGMNELRNWDLWGPLILCFWLALMLAIGSDEKELVFGMVFVVVWVGSSVVTINAKLLRGRVSFMQAVCVIGYCTFPLDLGVAFTQIIGRGWMPFGVKAVIIAMTAAWCSIASVAFMGSLVANERKVLAVYPVVLYYLFLAWVALIAC